MPCNSCHATVSSLQNLAPKRAFFSVRLILINYSGTGLGAMIGCRLYHRSRDTMDGPGSCIHTPTLFIHNDSLEDAIHVGCYTLS
jgi:hypothetical protein